MDFALLSPETNSGRMYTGPERGRCWPPPRPGTGLLPSCTRRQPHTGWYLRAGRGALAWRRISGDDSAAAPTSRGCDPPPPGRADSHRSQSGGSRLRGDVRGDGAPTGDRSQPRLVAGAGGDQFIRAKHSGDAATETLYAEMWAKMPRQCTATRARRRRDNAAFVHTGTADTNKTSAQRAAQEAATQLASATAQGLTAPAAATDTLGTLADLIDIGLFCNVAQIGLTH